MQQLFTPKERLLVYKQLLNRFTVYKKQFSINPCLSGLCSEIKDITGKPLIINNVTLIFYFPELLTQKPLIMSYGDKYWWSINTIQGVNARIKAIKNAITLVSKNKL